ncbi:MAG: SGNH/GDSL hydrolase family protein [Planctomycetota bacterium]|nr:MAG: SGNH/GDSL hydrolase family protein [Planctomycetota bacterium]
MAKRFHTTWEFKHIMPPHLLNRRQAIMLSAIGTLASLDPALLAAEDESPRGQLQVRKVLFLGNSITLHGPAPQIGWTGNWGMAASREELDYAHRLTQRIGQHASGEPQVLVKNIADFERGLDTFPITEKLAQELGYQADLVVLAIGENVAALNSDELQERYAKAFASLVGEIQKQGPSTLLIRSCFWADAVKDKIMRRICESVSAVWVDISTLGHQPENSARSERTIEHAGVAGHPGDRGMQAIADALWMALTKQRSLWKE